MSARESRQFETLSRAARAWAAGEEGPAHGADASVGAEGGWPLFQRGMQAKRRRATQGRVLAAIVAGGVTAAAGLWVTVGGLHRQEQQATRVVVPPAGGLQFTVDGVQRNGAGTYQPIAVAPEASAPARLSFTDGSTILLDGGTRGGVVATSRHGARFRLDGGHGRFAIVHRAETEWSVAAGPYTIVVHGTTFDVDWSTQANALVVDLHTGRVTVHGPVPGGVATLAPGQRLQARADAGEAHIEALSEDTTGTPPAPEAANDAADAAEGGEGAAEVVPPGGAEAAADDRAPGPREAPRRRLRATARQWPGYVTAGDFQTVLDEADRAGIEHCLGDLPPRALGALADAARFARRGDLARRALLAGRTRFPRSPMARDAAFFLGRLSESGAGANGAATPASQRQALVWYDRYLSETENGAFTAEALARKIAVLTSIGQREAARASASVYLERFPHGPYADRARQLAGGR